MLSKFLGLIFYAYNQLNNPTKSFSFLLKFISRIILWAVMSAMIFQNIYMNTISPLRNRSYLGRIKKICMDLRLGIPVLFVALLLNKLFVKLVELYLASTVLKYKKAIMAKENYIKDLLFDLGEDLSTAVTTYMSKMLTEENSTLKEKIKNTEASLTATNKDNENKNVQIVAYKSFANNLGEFSWCGDCMSCIAYCQPLFIDRKSVV